MSKREHNLQKGLQVQQFITTTTSSSSSVTGKTAREVRAAVLEGKPPILDRLLTETNVALHGRF